MNDILAGKVVIVTGGAGLIGNAVSSAIVEAGGVVVMVDVNQPSNDSASTSNNRARWEFFKGDATDPVAMHDIIQTVCHKYGAVHGAVHAAYPRTADWGTNIEDLKPDALAENLSMQLGGAILFSQQIMKQFDNQGFGSLVHVSSIQGVAAPKFRHYAGTKMTSPVEYSAVKAGIISTTRWLAKYYMGQDIRANCISPGGILDNQNPEFLARYRSDCNSKGMMAKEDLTGLVVFLLSSHSAMITGQNIVVDDGWSL